MNIFWLRFGIYIFIWVLLIVQDSEQIAVSILFMAIATAFYFLLSLKNIHSYTYILLSLIIAGHALFITDYFYTVIMFIYLSIFALFKLGKRELSIYLIVHFICIGFIVYFHSGRLLETMMIFTFMSFLIMMTGRLYKEKKKQKMLYDQLHNDFRKLKRMNVSAEQAARLEERTKIMRDLHDSVGHRLTALIMKLEMLAIQTGDEQYRSLKKMAEESLEETREAVSVLQTEESEGIATVVQLIRKLESESHILVQFTLKQGVLAIKLSNDKNIRLYRVIQEALTNAMRHAHSREVQVMLGRTAIGEVSFEVRNRVHDPKPFEFGFGLQNMQERVHEIGGKLSVYQTDCEFVISGSFPIDEEE